MFVIDLRSDRPMRTPLRVGQRIRLDLSDLGAGIVTGTVTNLESDEIQISGRPLPLALLDRIEVVGHVDAQELAVALGQLAAPDVAS